MIVRVSAQREYRSPEAAAASASLDGPCRVALFIAGGAELQIKIETLRLPEYPRCHSNVSIEKYMTPGPA